MADSDLMSYIEDPNHQWQPLQPTSTPSVFMAETPDPVVQQYMSQDFDPLLPRAPPGNMSDFGLQCPPFGQPAMQPMSQDMWLQMKQNELDKRQHDFRVLEMQMRAQHEQRQMEAEMEQRQIEADRENDSLSWIVYVSRMNNYLRIQCIVVFLVLRILRLRC